MDILIFSIYEGGQIKWRIENHSNINKIINRLYSEVVEIENKFNRCILCLEVNEHIVSLGFI